MERNIQCSTYMINFSFSLIHPMNILICLQTNIYIDTQFKIHSYEKKVIYLNDIIFTLFLSVCLSLSLSVFLSLFICICLSFSVCLSVSLSDCLSLSLQRSIRNIDLPLKTSSWELGNIKWNRYCYFKYNDSVGTAFYITWPV